MDVENRPQGDKSNTNDGDTQPVVKTMKAVKTAPPITKLEFSLDDDKKQGETRTKSNQ